MAYATVAELAEAVRARVTAASTPALQRAIDAATEEIDAYLDRAAPPATPSALVHAVCIVRGVEWYKANDAALGVLGNVETGTIQTPSSSFDRHAAVLTPLVENWGVA